MINILFSLLKKTPLTFRLKIFYWLKFHNKLNLNNPVLYSEKIQARKLNQKKEYSVLSDKYKVRDYVSSRIGNDFLIKLLCCYDKPDDIDFSYLPNKFVIKTNFGSGSQHIEIIKNKNDKNRNKIIEKFNNAFKSNYKGSVLGETQYDSIEKKIIIEEYIENNKNGIDDFKFHIFNSSNGFLQIDFDRFINHKRNLYNLDFQKLDYDLCYSGGEYDLPSLSKLNEMKEIAFKLSQGFDYVRIDLYLVEDKIFFGEMTFTPGSGFEKFSKPIADKLYGQMWNKQ